MIGNVVQGPIKRGDPLISYSVQRYKTQFLSFAS